MNEVQVSMNNVLKRRPINTMGVNTILQNMSRVVSETPILSPNEPYKRNRLCVCLKHLYLERLRLYELS